MPLKHPLLFRIGTLALAFCAVLSAQLGTSSKWPGPSHNQRAAKCINCVQELSGFIPPHPALVREFRSTHPCPANRLVQGACPGYLIDLKKPLDRGGKDTSENLRWRTMAQAAKERVKLPSEK
jgi:hypothetical protein